MKKRSILFLLLFVSFFGQAQQAEDSVKAVINKLFASMKNSDAAGLATCFADSAILQTITQSGQVKGGEVKNFLTQIGTLPKGAADERIQFEVVRVDDALATVWTPYEFYFNGKFSHCGVNSFQLVRMQGEWKIQYLIDTRRKQGCK